MAFSLPIVLKAAPAIISAATDVIRVIKATKSNDKKPVSEKLDDVESLIEKQARVIEELAVNNENLALAVRNTRIITLVSLVIGIVACILAIWVLST